MNPPFARLAAAILYLLACDLAWAQSTYIPSGATWSYRAGITEASNPTSAWRGLSFVETDWSSGAMPFWYGDTLPGGTQIAGMINVHTSLFFRKTFTVANPTQIGALILNAKCDDGYIAWINGVEVARYNVTAANPTIASVADTSVAEPPPSLDTTLIPDPRSYLVSGTNVLAVMAFNNTVGSSDLGLDLTLRSTGADATAPVITAINPPPGQTAALNEITVTFSEPVRGITADDLVINQTAASAVIGSGATWIFSFPQPAFGEVLVSFSPAHDVSDLATPAHVFDETAPTAKWAYNLSDNIPPVVAGLNPPANATVNALSQFEVTFSEPVTALTASDLLVGGVAATGVTNSGVNKYTFTFPARPAGPVSVAWIGAHGISDLAVPPNAFAGGSWSYMVDPNAVVTAVRINEFNAANQNGLADENAEKQDWVEIHNPTNAPVSLDGWSLTDDESYPDKWIFPARTVPAGGYLVVFCSAKDRRTLTGNLHTNFKLAAPAGEYLALFNSQSPRQVVSSFSPEYPEQRNDYSYGIDSQGIWRYYVTPTPGAANGTSAISGVVNEVNFSVTRGFFDTPFQLHLTCPTAGATIRYTLDGSAPSVSSPAYTGPVSVTNTTCIRAAAFAANTLPSLVRTHTYVFPGLVRNQTAAPPGFPTLWGTGGNQTAADYEVDLTVTNDPNYSATFPNDLLSIPSMSIVMKLEDIFGATGINGNPGSSGLAWERAASLEMIYPDGRPGFQQDCGMRIQGGFGRSVSIKKHSFRPLFKGDYGASKLKFPLFDRSPVKEFDTFTLRAGMNNSYVLSTGEAGRATFTEDEWMRQTQRAMGQVSGYGNFVHLYINGLYWGLYNATERPSAPFAAAHLGGDKEEWDALNSSEAIDGVKTAWTALVNLCSSGANVRYIVDQNEWNQVMSYLDVDNFIVYMLLNFYGGNQDWDDHNWYSARRRITGAGYKFFSWDGERTLETPTGQDKTGVNQADKPSRIYAALRGSTAVATAPLNPANVEFRVRFADHIQKHMFANGPLTTTEALARWNGVEAQIDRAVVGESARWGDKLREPPYTRNAEFMTEVNRKRNTQFPQRTAAMITQLRTAKLFPPTNLVAPAFSQNGGKVAAGFGLTMTTTTTGTIYYTLDGSDPRQAWTATLSGGSAVDWSGSVAPGGLTYSAAVPLSVSGVVKARVRETSSGLWSALSEAAFQVGELGVPLRITEIMYNPLGGDAYEFLEVQNIGVTPIDLGLMTLEGIDFTFVRNTILAPGARLVIASDVSPVQWAARYPGITPVGYFGGALSNGGEYLAIRDANGNIVTSLEYSDSAPWPTQADGTGRSLEFVNFGGDPASPDDWRASVANNGTPGGVNQNLVAPIVRINEVLARNTGAAMNGGVAADYVEIYNPGSVAVDMSDWTLRPNASLTGACRFPQGTSIAAGAYLVVWCGPPSSGLQAAAFLQDRDGSATLNDSAGTVIDSIRWGQQIENKAIGQVNGSWVLVEPSPGAANSAAPTAPAAQLAINEFLVQSRLGQQWIELTNRDQALPAALNGAYVQTGGELQRIRSLSFIPSGGYLVFQLNGSVSPSSLDLRLPVSNSSITLYGPNAVQVNSLAYASTQAEVSHGRLPNGTGTLTSFPYNETPEAPNVLVNYAGPTLNEILARNEGVVLDVSGNWPDFVEFFNPGTGPFDMSGMKVRTDPLRSDWVFPAGSLVPAAGYFLLWCDGSRPPDATNTGRDLPEAGGFIALLNPAGQQVDGTDYGSQARNLSIGKAAGLWRLLTQPTPGAVNAPAATLGTPSSVKINEWMASPASGEDWVELYNGDTLPVDLSGLYLTDDPSLAGRKNTTIPARSFIGPRGYIVFEASADSTAAAAATNFKLAAEGESLRLYTGTLTSLDAVDFGLAQSNVSRGRYSDGAATLRDFPRTPSRGFANYLDSDNDGVPDAWETANGLDPLVSDADGDPDGDGQSNLWEYRTGTNARDAASLFATEIKADVAGYSIRFNAQQDVNYTVQVKDDLLTGAWKKLRDIPAGEARSVEVTDSSTTGSSRFYRVVTPRQP